MGFHDVLMNRGVSTEDNRGLTSYTLYLIPDILKRGLRAQEHRLVPAIFSSFGVPVGLFIFGKCDMLGLVRHTLTVTKVGRRRIQCIGSLRLLVS
jgi:hypothetical protein